MNPNEWNTLQKLLHEIIDLQEEKVCESAERIIPGLTRDDLLQPNDFPALENHPHFRYEEGVLEGMRSVAIALQAWQKEQVSIP